MGQPGPADTQLALLPPLPLETGCCSPINSLLPGPLCHWPLIQGLGCGASTATQTQTGTHPNQRAGALVAHCPPQDSVFSPIKQQ